ncbi:MAG: energy transducer TonB [Bryobacteraceae bacterium]
MNAANESSPAPSLRRLPFLIRLAPQFVNHLFAALEDKDRASLRISGLLFGRIENDFAVVQVFRSFSSSDVDGHDKAGAKRAGDEAFDALMARAKGDRDLAGLNLLGWFSARESGGLHAEDLAFHQKHFRQRNDIAMIVWSEPAGGLSLEIFCRCQDGTLFAEGHRSGTVRIADDLALVSPVEVLMRPKNRDELHPQSYEFREGAEEDKASLHWKGALTSKTKRALELLKKVASEHEGANAVHRDHLASDAHVAHSLALGAAAAGAAAPARLGEAAFLREEQQRMAAGGHSFPLAASSVASPTVSNAAPVPRDLKRALRDRRWLAMSAMFAVAAGGTFWLIYLKPAHARSTPAAVAQVIPTDPGLNLTISSNGDRVQLSWNRNSPAIRNADEGTLNINDGPDHRQVQLGSGELANGSVLYFPNTDDVVFQLKVHGTGGQNASETLRVLGSTKPTALNVSQSKNRPDDTPDLKRTALVTGTAGGKPQLARQNVVDASRSVPMQPTHEAAENGDFRATDHATTSTRKLPRDSAAQSPSGTPATKTAADAVIPSSSATANPSPTSQMAENVPPAGVPSGHQTLDSSANVITNHSAQALPAAGSAGLEKSTAGQIPVPAQVQPAQNSSPDATPLLTYRPPHPLKQVLPKLSTLPPGVADSAGEVSVAVKVDETGHVVEARIMEGNKKVSSIVKAVSLSAAKQWVFQPASLHGQSIASEHTILFQFRH